MMESPDHSDGVLDYIAGLLDIPNFTGEQVL